MQGAWAWVSPVVALTAAGLLLATSAALAWWDRRRMGALAPGYAPDERRDEDLHPSAWRGLTTAISGLALVFVGHLRFRHDDFTCLNGLRDNPLGLVGGLRVIGVDLPFRLAGALGGHPVAFALVNGLALAGGAFALRSLLLRLGAGPVQARWAAALYLANPATLEIAQRAVGFQWVAALAVQVAALWWLTVAVQASEAGHRRLMVAALLALAGLLALGPFTKYPILSSLPLVLWLWARYVLPRRPAWLGGAPGVLFFALPFLLALVSALPLEQGAGEFTKASPRALAGNVARLVGACTLGTLVLAFTAWVLAWRPATGRWLERGRCALGRRLGRQPAWRTALIMILGLSLPVLFKRSEFSDYYAAPGLVGVAVFGSGWLALAPPARGWSLPLRFGVTLALLAPVVGLIRVHQPTPWNRVSEWARQIAAVLPASPPPCALVLEASCADQRDLAGSRADLREFYSYSEAGAAIRWVRGWRDVPIHVAEAGRLLPNPWGDSVPCHRALHVGWCRIEGHPQVHTLHGDDP